MKASIFGILCFLIFFPISNGQNAESTSWDYSRARGSLDPKHWYLDYEVCKGVRQSPVNIDCNHIYVDHGLKPLQFQNYDQPIRGLLLHNDGHTIKIDVPVSAGLRLLSDSLPATYRLSQFHFHWGTRHQGGSEHKINNKRWPLEMHLVHVDENIPADQTTIDQNGLVVVSVLFDHNNEPPTDVMDTLTRSVVKVVKEGDNTTLSDFVISRLLPANYTNNYLRYSGSLTTPPCAEVVEWIILTSTMTVTGTQLLLFRSTRQRIHALSFNADAQEVRINENDRPLQPLNNRPIRMMGDLGTGIPRCDGIARITFD